MARPEGDICTSADQGRTWTVLVTFGMRLYAPSFYALHDGTLVCLHGSYAPGHGGLRLTFSTAGGHTWIAPAKDHGLFVDNCYGYGKAIELPDTSLLVFDQDSPLVAILAAVILSKAYRSRVHREDNCALRSHRPEHHLGRISTAGE